MGKMYKYCTEYVKLMDMRHYAKFVMGFDDELIGELDDEISMLEDKIREVLR